MEIIEIQMRPTILNPLFAPLSSLAGIGPKLEKSFARLLHGAMQPGESIGIGELLFHAPHSVVDRRNQPKIMEACHGSIVTLKVRVDRHRPAPHGAKGTPYRVYVSDESGEMTLVFFRGNAQWLEKKLPIGEIRYVSGTLEWYHDEPNMIHPHHIVSKEEFTNLPLVEPVYPAVSGLSQKILARSIGNALKILPKLPEWGDFSLIAREKWQSFNNALMSLHHPANITDLDARSPARRRLAYDEYLSGQLALALLRLRLKKTGGKARKFDGMLAATIRNALPYKLTTSQNQSLDEITEDIRKPERMLRLLQGDVGSGKTIVALLAMACVVEDGAQAALMVPTEILARQHFHSIAPLCKKAGVCVEILTGKEKGAIRKSVYERLQSGEIQIIIGTHALFQPEVEFASLGLVVIDEQHRFGVHQRLMLSNKGGESDILVMTATPIPRTLVMTLYGDMEISGLTQKPAGRQPVKTSAIAMNRIDLLMDRLEKALKEGQKAFWICPLVDESDSLNLMSATRRFDILSRRFDFPMEIAHGQMKSEQKDRAMEAFRNGDARLLVATTVIEVGIDVPDATIMVIEHAERFGLAQIHQLRGRVGRSSRESHCILLYKSPPGKIARERMDVMRQSNDGFYIAEEDLRLRGEGELLGARQSGAPGFALASSEYHGDILKMARNDAQLIIETNPKLEGQRGEALRILLYLFRQDQAIRLLSSG